MEAELYTKDNCQYCVRAKALLEKHNIPYSEIDAVENCDALIERVSQDTGSPPRTAPQIYIDGQYIGGYDQLVAWVKTNVG